MTTITVDAIYRNGRLEPQVRLNLPDNTPVQLQVTLLPGSGAASGSLFGSFPELATLADGAFAWAKRLWEHGLDKQSRILDGLA